MWYRKDNKNPAASETTLQTRDDFRGLIDQMFSHWDTSPDLWGSYPAPARKLTPLMNVSETDSGYEIETELPGVDKKDIELNLHDNILTIKGEKKGFNEEKKDKYHKIERSHGSFQRSVRLPSDIDVEKVSASMEHGILHVEVRKLQKSPESKRSIEIR